MTIKRAAWAAMLALVTAHGCGRGEIPPECTAPRVYVVSEPRRGQLTTVAIGQAWAQAMRRHDRCDFGDDGAEVWLTYHEGITLMCAEFPPYLTCASRLSEGVFAVEVNLATIGPQPTIDMVAHEFSHVLMRLDCVPRTEHHALMDDANRFDKITNRCAP